jgi:Fe-S oxidoreductase
MEVKTMAEMTAAGNQPDILFWVGCAGSYDDRAKKITKSLARILDHVGQKRILADYQPALKSDPEQRLQALIRSTVKGFDELDQARDEVRAGRVPQLPQAAKKSSRPMVISPGSSRR